VRERAALDFNDWKGRDSCREVFDRLLRDLWVEA
jgi:hypothetical protein